MLTVGFDLDLTLVDSRHRITASYRAAFADLGRPIADDDVAPHLGLPLAMTARHIDPDIDIDEFVARYRFHYDQPDAPPHTPMPGAGDALAAVHAAGGRCVVVSAKYGPAVVKALAEAGLADLVDTIHAERFEEGKTEALRAEGATIYVGDHVADMVSATGVPATGVAVTTGSFSREQLADAGADVVLDDLRQFGAWLAHQQT